jgi:hypothetical protein
VEIPEFIGSMTVQDYRALSIWMPLPEAPQISASAFFLMMINRLWKIRTVWDFNTQHCRLKTKSLKRLPFQFVTSITFS